MKHILAVLALLTTAAPVYAGCTGYGCVDNSGNVFTVSPQGTIQGFNSQTGQHFNGTQFSNGVTIITPVPQGLPPLPLVQPLGSNQ
jgi:hypothetical protein